MKRRAKLDGLVWYAVSTVILIVVLFPIYWMFMVSLKLPEEIFKSPPIWFPKTPQFGNFAALFIDGDVWSLWNSLVIAGVSTLIAMVLGHDVRLCDRPLQDRRRQSGDLDSLAAHAAADRRRVSDLPCLCGIRTADSYPGLILLYTAFALPYVMWMMRGYLEDVPVELEEAALVDGYSHLSVLWRVTVPMARNGLIATAIFAFVFSWNEFLFALVLTRTEVITFTVQISQYFGSQSTFWAKIAAMSVLGTLPVFIAVTLLQRYLVRGISMGAVKG